MLYCPECEKEIDEHQATKDEEGTNWCPWCGELLEEK